MANVYAVKNGDWSDTSVWNTASLPANADSVYTNGYDVLIETEVDVESISNSEDTGIASGGSFIINNDSELTFNDCFPSDDSDGLIKIEADCTVTINGPIKSGPGNGIHISEEILGDVILTVSEIEALGDDHSAIVCLGGNLQLQVLGDVSGGVDGSSSALQVTGDMDVSVSIQGSVYAAYGAALDINITGNSEIRVDGDVYGGSEVEAYGIVHPDGNLQLSVGGDVHGGLNTSADGVLCGGAEITIEGSVYGGTGAFAYGISCPEEDLTINVSIRVDGGSGERACGIEAKTLDLETMYISGGDGLQSSGVHVYTIERLRASTVTGGEGSAAYGIYITGEVDDFQVGDLVSSESTSALSTSSYIPDDTRKFYVTNISSEPGVPAFDTTYEEDRVIFSGELKSSSDGTFPIRGAKIFCSSEPENSKWTVKDLLDDEHFLVYSSVSIITFPLPEDVRRGVPYGGGEVGVLDVPSKEQVMFGVPVDGEVGESAIDLNQLTTIFGQLLTGAFDTQD